MIEPLREFLRSKHVEPETLGVVFDIGSRDGVQALELADSFPRAKVVAIECNPGTLEQCRDRVRGHPGITLVEKAINVHTGRCPFYPIDPERTVTTWSDGNPGASSLFLANGTYDLERYVQREIEVECTRIDDLCRALGIDAIDLIWMDLQGAELLALQSAGSFLDRVRFIHTEVSFRPIYSGQCLFDEVDSLLGSRGFRRCSPIHRAVWQQDVIYENTRTLVDVAIPLGPRDFETVEFCARSAGTFVEDVRHVYVIGPEDPMIPDVRFVDERTFPFDLDLVRSMLGTQDRAGWYLQQLLKLYFPLIHSDSLDHVLALDADTVFLNRCRFTEEGKTIFNVGDEYHPPYFAHMARLHPSLQRVCHHSGIVHCMLFRRDWIRELCREVETQHDGVPFWKTYLDAVDPVHCEGSGASEYEIYFNFCLRRHRDDVILRRFRWQNVGRMIDVRPDAYDYVSLHHYLRAEPIDKQKLARRVFNREPSDPT